jgi:ketopantoate reductase
MKQPVVIIGIGEIGGVLARGFLRCGHPVFPVNRGDNLAATAAVLPEPAAVVLAVAEKDFAATLDALPPSWRDRLVLLQNELLPKDFAALPEPTVISIWFEKKPGQDAKVIIPSPVFGPRAELLQRALASVGIPTTLLDSETDLLFELVAKNLYILVSNIAGLEVGGTVGELWSDHQQLARDIAAEILMLQQAMTGAALDRERLLQAMQRAFAGDPEHRCMGRSAPARLRRALAQAAEVGVDTPVLAGIRERQP